MIYRKFTFYPPNSNFENNIAFNLNPIKNSESAL